MVKPDAVVCGLLAAAALLLGANLGNGLLWQDEAETALLARHTWRFGYPRAHDGRSPMEIQKPYNHGPGEAWIYSPWAPFYFLVGIFVPCAGGLVAHQAWRGSAASRRQAAWVALAAAALLTSLLGTGRLRVPLTDLCYELTHAYRGPMEGVVAYLRAHGSEGQSVKIPYDE